jgi:hypothetical protein
MTSVVATPVATPVALISTSAVTRRAAAGSCSRCGLRFLRGDGGGLATEHSLQPTHESASVCRLLCGRRCGRCRDGLANDDGSGGRGQHRGHGCRLCLGLFLFRSQGLGDGRSRRHEIAQLLVLRQLRLVVADAPDRVLRRLNALVRNDDELGFALVLERPQPLALLIEQIGRHVHGNLSDHSRRAVLAQLFTDEPQDCERHGLDAADGADPDAARADDMTGLPQRGPQSLPGHLEKAEPR